MAWTRIDLEKGFPVIAIKSITQRHIMKSILITVSFGYAALLNIVAPDALGLVSQFSVLFGAIILGSFVLIVSGVQSALGKPAEKRQIIIWNSIINAIISVPITLGLTFFTLLILHALVNYYLAQGTIITVFQRWESTLAVGMFWQLFGFGFRSMGSWVLEKVGNVNISIGGKNG